MCCCPQIAYFVFLGLFSYYILVLVSFPSWDWIEFTFLIWIVSFLIEEIRQVLHISNVQLLCNS